MADRAKTPDEDMHKGAVEDDTLHPDAHAGAQITPWLVSWASGSG